MTEPFKILYIIFLLKVFFFPVVSYKVKYNLGEMYSNLLWH